MDEKTILKVHSQQTLKKLFHQVFNIYNIIIYKHRKYDIYRGRDFMKMFCESLREYTIRIIILKKKKK